MPWPFRRDKSAPARFAAKHASLFVGMGAARWLNRSYRTLALEGFENNPVVFACVTKLARAAASVDLQLYDYTRQGELRRIERHDLLDLMANPNPLWSGRRFIEKVAVHKLIGGNAFVLGVGSGPLGSSRRGPSELWTLQPDLVEVKGERRRMLPEAYEYRPVGQDASRYPVDQVTGLSEVLHLKTVNPLDDWMGLPPLAAAAYGVDVFNAGQEWNKSLLQNEGRPSGALQMRQGKDGYTPTLTDEQFGRLKAELDEVYSGPKNAGRPLLLDSALEWVQLSMSSRDMDHRETMLATARLIAACYGTPPQLVNIPGESTYSNYEQATLAYWSDTVLPFLGSLLDDFNRWLPALFGQKCFLWYDEEQIPALEPRRKEKSARIQAATFMTPNEKRAAMGMAPYSPPSSVGADTLFVDAKSIPVEMAGEVDPNLHPTLAEDGGTGGDPPKSTN